MSSSPGSNDELTCMEPLIKPELARRLLLLRQRDGPTKRITNETLKAVSELLRLFVVEAQSRASIEAECDNEGEIEEENEADGNQKVQIRADHITKIAAELLMDFS